jgi:hypothetical protein
VKRCLALTAAAIVAAASSLFLVSPAFAASPTCNTSAGYDTNIPWPNWPGHYIRAKLPAYQASGQPATSTCTLRRGNSGEAVGVLQNTLNECFNLSEVLEEDGIFGGRTEAMLKQAQGYAGTAADGVYGPDTRNHFNYDNHWATYDPYGGWLYCQSVNGLP